jgi:flagellin
MADADRQLIQDEVAQLKEEVTRIANTTEFNSQKLLNGEFDLKSYTSEQDIKINKVSDEVSIKIYEIESLKVETNAEGELEAAVVFGADSGFPDDIQALEMEEGLLTLKASGGFEMVIDTTAMVVGQEYTNVQVDVTGIGAMRLQIGSNEGQVLPVRIPEISLQNLGIEDIDVSTEVGANEALARMTGANAYISSVRSRLGAYQNRLESSINSLDITNENMTAAYSRIMDVDMAEEMTKYTTYQVLTQAGTSMLAQANERPQNILNLLQG